jgi:chromate transporter
MLQQNLDDRARSKAETAGSKSAQDVFWAFLKLGVTSFGGPIAHLGYFRHEFVVRRKWIDEASYGELIGLCQFLPGPTSSQVGFALGILRGRGLAGGLAAWLGFTAPSALILLAFGLWASAFHGRSADGLLHGLKLVAVAVVAQAIWGMSRTLTPDRTRAAIAFVAFCLACGDHGSIGQVLAIALGAVAGLLLCRAEGLPSAGQLNFPVSRGKGAVGLVLFAALFLVPVLGPSGGRKWIEIFGAFYRSGALVFGGGHVVLPLLQAQVVRGGWVSDQAFLAGYGVAQAVPGPLFTFAAYLGSVISVEPDHLLGAAIALVAIFLPGLLLVYGMLPFWDDLRSRPSAQAAMRGASAAVVGILGAAFYSLVRTGAILTSWDLACALGGFLLLTVWQAPPWMVVALLASIRILSVQLHGL